MWAEAHLYLGVALAGLVSFLSPCVLPLVPPYLGYLGGTTLEELIEDEGLEQRTWLRIVAASVFFVLGFTTVFVGLGAAASALGQFFLEYRGELAIASGILIILFGLHFLGWLPVHLFYREARFHAHNPGATYIGAYLMGLAFAFGWTPCIGPIYSAVISLAAQEDTLAKGVSLLVIYSLGLGLPFILAAIALRPFLRFSARFKPYLARMEKAMGVLLILTGLLFIFGYSNALGSWFLDKFPAWGQMEQWVTPKELRDDILSPLRQ